MLNIILISLCLIFCCESIECAPWIAYGDVTIAPYTAVDNPITNINGLAGEQSFPYIVPAGYQLTITYMQAEGPTTPQFGIFIWLGPPPATNARSLISCTTAGGSTQLYGMQLIIPPGSIVNLRCMNNTATPWVNGFCIQGTLDAVPLSSTSFKGG
jgi:hypothetical protein